MPKINLLRQKSIEFAETFREKRAPLTSRGEIAAALDRR